MTPSGHTEWIQTYTGRQFFVFDPKPEDVDIEDIAHALSNLCRYGGHSEFFYSVAQHSVLLSMIVPPEDALRGLLHDASEAYLIDVPTPIKHHVLMRYYRDTERVVQSAIYAKFGLTPDDPESIKIADREMLRTEQRDIMKPAPAAWADTREGARTDFNIFHWNPDYSEHQFLKRFEELDGNGTDAP